MTTAYDFGKGRKCGASHCTGAQDHTDRGQVPLPVIVKHFTHLVLIFVLVFVLVLVKARASVSVG